MDFITFEPNKSLRFIKKSNSQNLDETGGSPKNECARSFIYINNSSPNQIVGFKIKTTSPQSFCVRPSVGKVLPNQKAEVKIIVRAHDLNSIKTDKFLIQTTVVPDDIADSNTDESVEKIGEIFKKLEKLKKSNSSEYDANSLKEQRLTCDISSIPNIKTDESKKPTSLNSPESPNNKTLASPMTPNVSSPVKKSGTSDKSKDTELLEKNPRNMNEANAIIKELESAIQKYSVDSKKNDLINNRRYGKESINEVAADGKKEINDPKELFFEWNEKGTGKFKLPLDKSVQWPIAFLIVVIAFIIGAYSF